jgi:hypothetical protein
MCEQVTIPVGGASFFFNAKAPAATVEAMEPSAPMR